MRRPLYYFDTGITDYTKVDNNGVLTFDFNVDPQSLGKLRNPRCIVLSKSGRVAFKVSELLRMPGPSVDGMHPYRMALVGY